MCKNIENHLFKWHNIALVRYSTHIIDFINNSKTLDLLTFDR